MPSRTCVKREEQGGNVFSEFLENSNGGGRDKCAKCEKSPEPGDLTQQERDQCAEDHGFAELLVTLDEANCRFGYPFGFMPHQNQFRFASCGYVKLADLFDEFEFTHASFLSVCWLCAFIDTLGFWLCP